MSGEFFTLFIERITAEGGEEFMRCDCDSLEFMLESYLAFEQMLERDRSLLAWKIVLFEFVDGRAVPVRERILNGGRFAEQEAGERDAKGDGRRPGGLELPWVGEN